MNVIAQIPNLLTLSNLICGALAIYFISTQNPLIGAYLVLLAAVFDFFDGFAARALKVSGEMGKQLDSLADMVSFGVAPAFIAIYYMGVFSGGNPEWFNFLPVIMTAFAGYRLGKFNIDTRQTDEFIGLPTPANALFWISFPLIITFGNDVLGLGSFFGSLMDSKIFIGIASLVCGILMVSELHLLSLKFKSFKWGENKLRFILIGMAILLFAVFGVNSLPIIILLYLILSVIGSSTHKKNGIQSGN